MNKEIEDYYIRDWLEMAESALLALLDERGVNVMRIGAYEVYRAQDWGVGVLFHPAPSHEASDLAD